MCCGSWRERSIATSSTASTANGVDSSRQTRALSAGGPFPCALAEVWPVTVRNVKAIMFQGQWEAPLIAYTTLVPEPAGPAGAGRAGVDSPPAVIDGNASRRRGAAGASARLRPVSCGSRRDAAGEAARGRVRQEPYGCSGRDGSLRPAAAALHARTVRPSIVCECLSTRRRGR